MKARPQIPSISRTAAQPYRVTRVCGAFSLLLVLLLAIASFLPTHAQQSKNRKSDKAKAPAQTQAAPASPVLPGTQQCEGALEVIPRRELTFVRKRRPAQKKAGSDEGSTTTARQPSSSQ